MERLTRHLKDKSLKCDKLQGYPLNIISMATFLCFTRRIGEWFHATFKIH